MTYERSHEIRALLLAALMTLSVVAGSAAFVGSVAASGQHDLQTGDGSGGNFSYLFAGQDEQLPKGNQSNDDTLRVEVGSGGQNFPSSGFPASMSLPTGSDIVFSTDGQTKGDIEATVIDEFGNEQSVNVDSLSSRKVDIGVDFEGGGLSGDPVAVRVRNLSFDVPEDASNGQVDLTWSVNGDTATYGLNVTNFPTTVTAADGDGGSQASVTAGAGDQTMSGSSGASTLVLQADDRSDPFPTSFETVMRLDNSNVTFNGNLSPSNLTASSDYGDAGVESINDTHVVVSLDNFSLDETDLTSDIVEVSGLTFDVPADAASDTINWTVGEKSDTYTLAPERLDTSLESTTFPRGKDQQPPADSSTDTAGIALDISASGKDTSGFHTTSEEIYVRIPAEYRNDLEFDQTAQPSVSYNSLTGDGSATVVNASTISVTITEDLDSDDAITLDEVTFNTTAIVEEVPGESAFESGLDVQYTPVKALGGDDGTVERDTNANVDVDVPNVSVGQTTFATDPPANDTGNGAISVDIEDIAGGQIASGTDVVVGLDTNAPITFNESQPVNVTVVPGGGGANTNIPDGEITVTSSAITVNYPSYLDSTSSGDRVLVEGASGDGLRFDVADASDGDVANVTVQTNAGDAAVTQTTDGPINVSAGGIQANKSEIAISGETLSVSVDDIDGSPATNVTVYANSTNLDGVNGTSNTTDNGVAVFDISPSVSANPTNATIDFTAPEVSEDIEVTVDAIAPRSFADNESVTVGEKTPVNITVETWNSTSGAYEGGATEVNVSSSDYNVTEVIEESLPQSTDSSGTATFTVNLTAEEDGGTFDFGTEIDGVVLNTTVEASGAELVPETGVLAVGRNVTDFEVQVVNASEDPQSGVTVFANSTDFDGLNQTATTADSQNATFDFDLSNVSDVGTIELNATLADGTEIAETIHTVDIRTNVSRLPSGNTTGVNVTVDGSQSDLSGETVFANSTSAPAVNGTETTDAAGNATFALSPQNAENATIAFETTVDGADIETTVSSVAPSIDAPGSINYGTTEDVEVTVTALSGADGSFDARDGETVFANSTDFDGLNQTNDTTNGATTLTFDLSDVDSTGVIDLNATVDGIDVETTIDVVEYDISASGGPLTAGENGTVTVEIRDADDDGVTGANVVASGGPLDSGVTADELGGGEYELSLTPTTNGTVDIDATDLGVGTSIEVQQADSSDTDDTDDSSTSSSAPGGGGGPPIAPPSDISVTDASLSSTETQVGEPVSISVTLFNDGSGDGTYEVDARAGIFTVGSKSVEVPSQESVTTEVDATFDSAGEFDVEVDGQQVGTVVVDPAPSPEGVETVESVELEDERPDEEGVTVELEEVAVDAITFQNASDGTVSVAELESLPEETPETPGSLIEAMEIDVPDELSEEPATVRLSVDDADYDGDPSQIRLARYNDGRWEIYQPETVEDADGETVYVFETPGFSTFAVFQQDAQQQTETATPTETQSGNAEEAGFASSFGGIIVGVIALVALVLAIAGARMYQQGKL